MYYHSIDILNTYIYIYTCIHIYIYMYTYIYIYIYILYTYTHMKHPRYANIHGGYEECSSHDGVKASFLEYSGGTTCLALLV